MHFAVGLYVVYGELVCAICTGMSLVAMFGFLLYFVREYFLFSFACMRAVCGCVYESCVRLQDYADALTLEYTYTRLNTRRHV